MSAIFLATQNGDLCEFKRIIDSMDKEEAIDFLNTPQLISGMVPFHVAAKHGFLDICEYLIELKASVDITDTNDRTPLHFAAKGKKFDIFDIACSKGYPKVLSLLISAGAKYNPKQKGVNTPLLRSLLSSKDASDHSKYSECVDILLNNDANVNHANADDFTKILMYEPSLNAVNKKNKTAVYYTIFCKRSLETLKRIVEDDQNQAVDLKRTYESGMTLLHIAAANQNIEIVKYLLEIGFEPDTPDEQGNTPLHTAASTRNKEIIEQLIQYGCDPTQANKKGRTVFAIATPNLANTMVEAMNKEEATKAREERKSQIIENEEKLASERIEKRGAKYDKSSVSSTKSKTPPKKSTLLAMTKRNGTLRDLPPKWQKLSNTSPSNKNTPRPWGGSEDTAMFQRNMRIMIRNMKSEVQEELRNIRISVEEIGKNVRGDSEIGFDGFSSSTNISANNSMLIPIPQNLEESPIVHQDDFDDDEDEQQNEEPAAEYQQVEFNNDSDNQQMDDSQQINENIQLEMDDSNLQISNEENNDEEPNSNDNQNSNDDNFLEDLIQ